MSVIVQFFRDNWRDVVYLVVALILFITNLVKGKVKVADCLSAGYNSIPDLIVSAEDKFGAGSGDEKFKYVFKNALLIIASAGNMSASEACKKYGVLIETFIESCLSTPVKKEVSYVCKTKSE